jgi:U3 small nucleolar RNA-associated protein 21
MLYAPFKSIGLVTDENPFVVNRLGEEIFITVSIGSHFQVFRFNKLTACLISKPVPGKINCIQVFVHILI